MLVHSYKHLGGVTLRAREQLRGGRRKLVRGSLYDQEVMRRLKIRRRHDDDLLRIMYDEIMKARSDEW